MCDAVVADAVEGFGQVDAKNTQGASLFPSLTNHMVEK